MKHGLLLVLMALLATAAAQAQMSERRKQYNLNGSHVAIGGYDPVAYFTEHKAVEGNRIFRADYEGVTYYFASKENLSMFNASPAKYEPEYGGWCAYAMGAKGEKVEVDPETFKIVNGKLYLFYNKFFNNTLKSWNKDENNLKSRADKNWTSLTKASE